MDERHASVLCFGEALVEFNQIPGEASRTLRTFGGDTSNVCVAAARSGARVGYISALGEDPFAELLRAFWRREGIDDRFVRSEPGAPTGSYFVTHDAAGHHFEYRRAGSAASGYRAQWLPREAITKAELLHLSGVSLAIGEAPREAAFEAMAIARGSGVRICLDTNLRLRLWPLAQAREVLLEALRGVAICLPSWDDISVLLDLEDRDAIVDSLLRLGIPLIALKLGAEGCYLATAEHRQLVPPYPVQALDATGAGDCFAGAFIARILAGDPPFAAARYANVAAALSTLSYGAVEGIPGSERVLAAMGRPNAT